VIGLSRTAYGDGVLALAQSPASCALYAETDAADHDWGVYTPDNLYSLNYNLSGAIMYVVENDDADVLMHGDVVVFRGMTAESRPDEPRVPRVAKVRSENRTAVAGVVYGRFHPVSHATQSEAEASTGEEHVRILDGPISPGERLLVVVQGAAWMNVSSRAGQISPGDLLSSSSVAGYAAKAPTVVTGGMKSSPSGCIIGKALESLEAGESTMYVFVTLQ